MSDADSLDDGATLGAGWQGSFAGQVAVINGGSQGLGRATAELMISRGLEGLVFSGRNETKGQATAAELSARGCPAHFIAADLSTPDAPERVINRADELFGKVHAVVNCAALTSRGSVWDTTAAMWDDMMDTNLRAPGLTISAAARVMKREGIAGSVVNIGSVAGAGGQDFLYPYAATKGALVAMTRNAAHALMRHQIRVNLLNPGWMNTPAEHEVQKRWHDAPDTWLEDAEQRMPFGRLIDPAEAARAICFLASAESGMMTGVSIDFDQSVHGAGDVSLPSLTPVWGEE